MFLGYEAAEMGWDLSTTAQSKCVMMMGSVWLRDYKNQLNMEGRLVPRQKRNFRKVHMDSFGNYKQFDVEFRK